MSFICVMLCHLVCVHVVCDHVVCVCLCLLCSLCRVKWVTRWQSLLSRCYCDVVTCDVSSKANVTFKRNESEYRSRRGHPSFCASPAKSISTTRPVMSYGVRPMPCPHPHNTTAARQVTAERDLLRVLPGTASAFTLAPSEICR